MITYKKNTKKWRLVFWLLFGVLLCAFVYSLSKENGNLCVSLSADLKEKCYADEVERRYERHGYFAAVEYVKETYSLDEVFAQSCHGYMHLIGQKSYSVYQKKSKVNLDSDTSICGYGFYHGFMIELFKSGVDFLEARKFCYYANKELGIGSQLLDIDCFHGVGHGVTDYNFESDLGVPDLKLISDNSAEICEKLSFGNWEQLRNCMNGVYHSIVEIIDEQVDKEDPLAFCKSEKEEFEHICLTAFGTVLMRVKGENFEDALSYAALLSDEKAIQVIQPMSGYQGYKKVKNRDYTDSILSCGKLRESLNLSCIRGIMEGVRDFGEPGKEAEEVISFCSNETMTILQKDECFKHATKTFDMYFGEGNKDKICELFNEKDYSKYCQ